MAQLTTPLNQVVIEIGCGKTYWRAWAGAYIAFGQPIGLKIRKLNYNRYLRN